MLADAITEISKIEITGLTEVGLSKVTFSGFKDCSNPIISMDKEIRWDGIHGVPAKGSELGNLNISLQYKDCKYKESLVGDDDREVLYELVANSDLPLSTLMMVFGRAIDTVTNRYVRDLLGYKVKVDSVIKKISEYPSDKRHLGHISIAELEELIK